MSVSRSYLNHIQLQQPDPFTMPLESADPYHALVTMTVKYYCLTRVPKRGFEKRGKPITTIVEVAGSRVQGNTSSRHSRLTHRDISSFVVASYMYMYLVDCEVVFGSGGFEARGWKGRIGLLRVASSYFIDGVSRRLAGLAGFGCNG